MNHESYPCLLCVDIQKGLDQVEYYGGKRNNPEAEDNIYVLIDFWRSKKWPIYHVKHNSTHFDSPLRAGQPGNEFKDCALPKGSEPIIEKSVNSAFIGTGLDSLLKGAGIRTIVICGLTTEHCISTTTRMSGNLGFETYLIEDAIAAFDKKTLSGKIIPADQVHEIELCILNGEFCTVKSTKEILQEF
ncbi:MAG: cysteine hydrolase [Saprospiraceae bacterium]|nr:cysteine hydrolase [Saprospiraceae bacterium]